MQGRMYTAQRCGVCGGPMTYMEGRGFFYCPKDPKVTWHLNCVVRFGRNHTKRFKTAKDGERHLNFLRVQVDRKEFDPRQWAKDQPLSFLALREKFADHKKTTDIGLKQIRHIDMVLDKAGTAWDRMQIGAIAEPEIEDFIEGLKVSNSTKKKYQTVLHDFWIWVVRREKRRSKIEMPEFPEIKAKMKMRTIVSVEDQQDILKTVKKMTWGNNPRIWLGIKLLSIYPRVRPGEMLNVKEGHINLSDGWIVFPQPKEKEPKFIHLVPQVIDLIKEVQAMTPSALPDMYFFRHLKTKSGVKAGVNFGPKYFNLWWKKACEKLGIEGVPVYPGTKHSTTTALGKVMSPEQIKHNVTGHTSNAFERYFLPDHTDAIQATQQVLEMQTEQPLNNIEPLKKFRK